MFSWVLWAILQDYWVWGGCGNLVFTATWSWVQEAQTCDGRLRQGAILRACGVCANSQQSVSEWIKLKDHQLVSTETWRTKTPTFGVRSVVSRRSKFLFSTPDVVRLAFLYLPKTNNPSVLTRKTNRTIPNWGTFYKNLGSHPQSSQERQKQGQSEKWCHQKEPKETRSLNIIRYPGWIPKQKESVRGKLTKSG